MAKKYLQHTAQQIDDAVNKVSELSLQVGELTENAVTKEEGKGLSANDFTDDAKNKLDGLQNYDDTELRNEVNEKANKVASVTEMPTDGIPLAGTAYKLGTIASLSINGIPTSDAETVIYFVADEGFTMSIPDCEVVGELSAEAGKSYVMSILNGIVIMGEVTNYQN